MLPHYASSVAGVATYLSNVFHYRAATPRFDRGRKPRSIKAKVQEKVSWQEELEGYLNLRTDEDDPCQFWGLNESRFPTLAALARDIFSIPATGAEFDMEHAEATIFTQSEDLNERMEADEEAEAQLDNYKAIVISGHEEEEEEEQFDDTLQPENYAGSADDDLDELPLPVNSTL
ncbi:uncharacterized protein KD926_000609 [Aspergillus affinis]|uniref:uncharacterized protein n=1 Tax=Aspergillus affinis TaxID=1070780 RepID=UPI0022FF370C|nr:uncharacterized protein KD926_000609 [Aspergillus affinis]KAI9037322.1 hypothetical protein KD926_000609 [Aspergillus affinis]